MFDWVKHEAYLRLGIFFGLIVIFALWELLTPRRVLERSKPHRWFSNFGIVVINTVVLRILFPASAVGVALFANNAKLGIFHWFHMDYALVLVLSVLALDFVIYLQHVMFHAIPNLWRFHRMHHLDLDFDLSTGLRFHPGEIIISMLIKSAAIILLGTPALAVLIFEVLLNATSLFNHSNGRMPLGLDKLIRLIVVTPDMHRVHHSVHPNETNSNFGFNFPWWDRLLGTYTPQPKDGHTEMQIGLSDLRETQYCVNLLGMLKIPFKGKITDYAINRRKG